VQLGAIERGSVAASVVLPLELELELELQPQPLLLCAAPPGLNAIRSPGWQTRRE